MEKKTVQQDNRDKSNEKISAKKKNFLETVSVGLKKIKSPSVAGKNFALTAYGA